MSTTDLGTPTTDTGDAMRDGESFDNRLGAPVDEHPDGPGITARQWWRALASAAGRPVAGESVVVVRCVFGMVAIVTAVRILALGWIDDLWVGPAMHLQWSVLAPPVPPRGAMVTMVVALGVLGFMVMVGVATRAAAALWVIGFGWIELLDKAAFLNHYWAMLLVATLLVVVPGRSLLTMGRGGVRAAHARFDVAGWRVRLAPVDPVPMWQVWLLRSQVAVIYGFAGIAKLDPDWLVRGEPMATWLAARPHVPLVGPMLADPTVAIVASWMGLAFDCTIVIWLWWRPTRVPAFMAVVAFHLLTWFLFPDIGVFPLLMVGLATVWLPPDWPTRVRLAVTGAQPRSTRRRAGAKPWRPVSNWVLIGVTLWVGVQVVVPLRHLALPGDVRWTEESSRFAWRVMAEDKAGWAVFTVTSTEASQRVPITDVLEPWQARVAATRPDMVLQVAHELAERTEAATGVWPTVTADVTVAWNGRAGAPLVDATVDLAAQPRVASHQPWILPAPS